LIRGKLATSTQVSSPIKNDFKKRILEMFNILKKLYTREKSIAAIYDIAKFIDKCQPSLIESFNVSVKNSREYWKGYYHARLYFNRLLNQTKIYTWNKNRAYKELLESICGYSLSDVINTAPYSMRTTSNLRGIVAFCKHLRDHTYPLMIKLDD